MTHASLFSGIGGFDLAAEWVGWTNLFNCEIDPFCQTILKYHFPNATQYSDIKTIDFTVWCGLVDVLTGGFPCQPFSVAGSRNGTDDNRYLWPQMLRAIREISPRWIVGENVRGIVSWSKGLVFEQVCSDLEALGYEVQPFLIPACAVDAPHRRDRVWFVAHRTDARVEDVQQRGQDRVPEFGVATNANSDRQWKRSDKQETISRSGRTADNCATRDERTIVDPKSTRFTARNERSRQKQSWRRDQRMELSNHWQNFPAQSPVCRGDDGFPELLDFNAVFAGIPKPKRAKAFNRWRKEAIRAYGNAVVPQVVLQFFNTINDYNNHNQ